MNSEQSTFWHVVYTKPNWEKKVADFLDKKGIEQYCPLNKMQKLRHDREKIVWEPLFKSYVFIKTNEQSLSEVKTISGIVNFVYWLGKPAVVKNEEIEAIREFLRQHKTVQLEKINVNVNDMVKVVSGPLIHREGKIVQISNQAVKITLPSIGYALIAQASRNNIEVVTPPAFEGYDIQPGEKVRHIV